MGGNCHHTVTTGIEFACDQRGQRTGGIDADRLLAVAGVFGIETGSSQSFHALVDVEARNGT